MSENQIVRVIGGIPAWSDNIVNSNLEDPLVVDNITANVSVTPNSIVDTLASSGTAGQVLQKSDPGNTLIWGPSPGSYVANGITAHLPTPAYFFPTARAIVQLAGTVGTSVNYSLASNVVSINNAVSEIINVNFYANVRVSDSSTFFNFYILVDGVDTVSYRTQYIQAGATNVYTSVNMNARLTVNPGAQIRIECQRAVGAGTLLPTL